jgi:hypothetical protein
MSFFPPKRPHFIFVACLALSVMGTFIFAAADLPAFDFRERKPITSVSIACADYAIDCLTEFTVKARGYSSLPSRKSTYLITPFGTRCAGITALFSAIRITKPINVPRSKDAILLKLRI